MAMVLVLMEEVGSDNADFGWRWGDAAYGTDMVVEGNLDIRRKLAGHQHAWPLSSVLHPLSLVLFTYTVCVLAISH
jgi:hypothetical protein